MTSETGHWHVTSEAGDMAIRPDTDDLIAFLNQLFDLDPDFMNRPISARVHCNEKIGHHPSVQVGFDDGKFHAGLLGVLNGYCGSFEDGPRKGWGPITALLNDDKKLTGFVRTEHVRNEIDDGSPNAGWSLHFEECERTDAGAVKIVNRDGSVQCWARRSGPEKTFMTDDKVA
jgi:hypothetical protein